MSYKLKSDMVKNQFNVGQTHIDQLTRDEIKRCLSNLDENREELMGKYLGTFLFATLRNEKGERGWNLETACITLKQIHNDIHALKDALVEQKSEENK